ncbi:FG-GAP-like repeat-containing protein [Hymenobacter yonginensis]|uniref:FG-GAP-like repeat-containing protein n=1 Tax=Hymenobacter yonginensis TaxID=748197 RepID=A0ABY7PQP4_9BACT|nr:FG-GAP-like repeat-containing protein [Hymenobacter yonginensis]WBO85241.1 FG-GAP-like repeat-containing protein [Hymenobacter yonginensis]
MAQPTVQLLTPARNAIVPRAGTVQVTFDRPLAARSSSSIGMYSTQRGGMKVGTATVSGAQLTFRPTTPLLAGEQVWVTLRRDSVRGTNQLTMPGPDQVWPLRAEATGGTGLLTPAARLAWQGPPELLVTADLDGNGTPDILATRSINGDYTSRVSMRFNDGSIRYRPVADIIIPYVARTLVSADVDNDGDLDVMTTGDRQVGSTTMPYLSVLRNQGNGTFTAEHIQASSAAGDNLIPADMDADGDLDLVHAGATTSGSCRLAMYLNSNGQFTGSSRILGSVACLTLLQLGDLDNDGDLDAVGADGGMLYTYLNGGAGSFRLGSSWTPSARARHLQLADLNADGYLDILTTHDESTGGVTQQRFRLWQNRQNLTFSSTPLQATGYVKGMTVADVDGDADVDVVYAYDSRIATLLNNGTGNFTAGSDQEQAFQLQTYRSEVLVAADVDSDGDMDLMTTVFDTDQAAIQVLRNGPAPVAPYAVQTTTPAAHRVAMRTAPVTATLSTSMQPAAAGALRVSGSQSRGLISGTASTSGNTLGFVPAAAYAPGELVSATLPVGTMSAAGIPLAQPYVWQFVAASTGGSGRFAGRQFLTIPPHFVYCIRLADIDGDQDLDILTSLSDDINPVYYPSLPPILSLRRNEGNGRFAAPVPLLGSDVRAEQFWLRDVDNDGDLDFVGGAYRKGTQGVNTAAQSVWLNDGRGTFTEQGIIDNLYVNARVHAVGDLNGDGFVDVVAAGGPRLNDGRGNFNGSGRFARTDIRGMLLTDVDNDGDLDALYSDAASGRYMISLNDGAGNMAASLPTAIVSGTDNIMARDMDGDGDIDVAAYSSVGYTRVHTNNGQGIFNAVSSVLPGYPIAVGDLDGDTDVDIVTTTSVGLNSGPADFSTTLPNNLLRNDIYWAELGDLDGDGDLDFAGCGYRYLSTSDWVISFNEGGAPLAGTLPAAPLNSLTFWPNPVASNGTITLQIPQAATVQLRTLTGQQLWHRTGVRGAVPIGNLAAGMYLLTVQLPGHSPETRRLVVQ